MQQASMNHRDAVTMSAIKNLLDEHQSEFDPLKPTRSRPAAKKNVLHGETANIEGHSRSEKAPACAVNIPKEVAPLAEPIAEAPTESRQAAEETLRPNWADPSQLCRHLTWRNARLAALLVAFALKPVLVTVLVLGWFAAVVGAIVVLGGDRVWRGVASMAARYCASFPARTHAVYSWLDSIACRWDAALDCLPKPAADALYMPDFSQFQLELEEETAAHAAIVDERLARMRDQL